MTLMARRFASLSALGVVLFVGCPPLSGAQAAAQPVADASRAPAKAVVFDHLNDDRDRSYSRDFNDGETFNVTIRNTCPAVFTYTVRGIAREEPSPGTSRSAGAALTDKTIPVVYDKRFGGYIVDIKRNADTKPCGADTASLNDHVLIISVRQLTWDLAFSGAFVLSNLVNPVFSLAPHPTLAGKQVVREDVDKEDAAQLGVAAFVHLFHQRMPWLAGTFGLGIVENNKTEYFLGGGVRLNDKASVNAGVVFGPVLRLPAGVNTTDPVADSNVLVNLPTRTRRGFFFGISYAFINVRDRFQQPFAGAPEAAAPAAKPAAASAPAASCDVKFEAVGPATITNDVLSVPAGGGTFTVRIVAPDTCQWAVDNPEADWAHVTTGGKTAGTAPITVTVEPNKTGTEQQTTLAVDGKKLAIKQAGS